jgi:hypothetical protein
MSSMSESNWWYLFNKEVNSWDFETCFRNWQFVNSKFWLKHGIFICIFWLNGSSFGGNLNEGVKTHLVAPMLPPNSPSSVSRSIVYDVMLGWVEIRERKVVSFNDFRKLEHVKTKWRTRIDFLTSLGPFLVQDAVSTLTTSDGVPGLDVVLRMAIWTESSNKQEKNHLKSVNAKHNAAMFGGIGN